MSEKSKRSAKAIDRPFPPAVLAKAKKIAGQYEVILACEDGHWYGRGLELPNIHGDGKTVQQCVENTREAFVGWVAYLLEEGQRPPTPAREGARTAQVNIRMTAEEKALWKPRRNEKDSPGFPTSSAPPQWSWRSNRPRRGAEGGIRRSEFRSREAARNRGTGGMPVPPCNYPNRDAYRSSNWRIIFWYWVWFFRARVLKNSTVGLLKPMVTLTMSCRRTSSSGGGRKSSTTSISNGSWVYLILLFIESSPFSPVACADDANDAAAERESHGQNSISYATDAVISPLASVVLQIAGNHALGIEKRLLRQGKRYPMLSLVLGRFVQVPLKRDLGHCRRLSLPVAT